MVNVKRIYQPAAETDGYRVLVDRLWPRGISKDKAALDLWLKDVAPSPELRTWFNHDPERYAEFAARYESELSSNPAVDSLLGLIKKNETVTLLYAAHDPDHNHANVLLDFLSRSK